MQTLKGFTPIFSGVSSHRKNEAKRGKTEMQKVCPGKADEAKKTAVHLRGRSQHLAGVKDVQCHIAISGVQFTDWTVTD